MNQLKKFVIQFSVFEKFLIGINVLLSFTFLINGNNYTIIPWLSLISSITTVVCVVLVAKRKISNYWWGFIGIITYIIVSFYYGNTGEWTIQAFYYLPMNIIGLIVWTREKNKLDETIVDSKKLSLKSSIIIFLLSFISVLLFAYLISLPSLNMFFYGQTYNYNFIKYFTDSTSTILSITAMILMIKRYQEQWILWIVINLVNIVLWSIFTVNLLMALMWACMLANSIYGYIKWRIK